MTRKNTIEKFIQKAQVVHKNKYNYSKVKYINSRNKVIIICIKHGDFLQSPSNHLGKRGCPKCKAERVGISSRSNTKEFITKAIEIHKNKYDYSKVQYVASHINITIICSTHGDFEQAPNNHLSGKGCSACGGSKTLSLDEFIERASFIHGNKYDYSKVNYKHAHCKVTIVCLKHGVFEQTPAAHVRQSQGCPKCSNCVSKMEMQWLRYLNILSKNQQKHINIEKKKIIVDGFDPQTNTIYEFYGDYWHGNPEIYDDQDMHPLRKCTYGELYKRTVEREELIKNAGFDLVVMWENDWKQSII